MLLKSHGLANVIFNYNFICERLVAEVGIKKPVLHRSPGHPSADFTRLRYLFFKLSFK